MKSKPSRCQGLIGLGFHRKRVAIAPSSDRKSLATNSQFPFQKIFGNVSRTLSHTFKDVSRIKSSYRKKAMLKKSAVLEIF